MKVSELIQMLQAILHDHGDVFIRCGQYRISCVMLVHGTHGDVSAVIAPRIPPPSNGGLPQPW